MNRTRLVFLMLAVTLLVSPVAAAAQGLVQIDRGRQIARADLG